MPSVTLLYIDNCPHFPWVQAVLKASELPFEEILQSSLKTGHPLRAYTSPTVLVDGEVFFGALSNGEAGCTLPMMGEEALREKLSRILP